jgi:MFS family permease
MFDKLDAYNLVANLVPGAALTYALNLSDFPTPPPSDILAFLLAAFVAGVTVNRLGSLVLDPFLRWKRLPFKFLKPKDYKSFVTSERDDSKLEILVANAGLYRTFFSAGFVYFGLLAFGRVADNFGISPRWTLWGLLIVAMFVFLFALKKEDDYIHQRLSIKAKED